MPTYRYIAKRGPKDTVEGVQEAASRAQVLSKLSGLGYIPVRVVEVEEGQTSTAATAAPASATTQATPQPVRRGQRVPARHLNVFTRQFASLVRASVPLLRSLWLLTEQTSHPYLRQLLKEVAEEIQHGQPLSEVLARHPEVFSPLYISMVRAGEVAGMLDTVLDRLVAQADRDEALRGKVRAALAYPLFVALTGIGTVAFLLTFVMPKLLALFAGYGSRLPMPTQILVAVTGLMRQWWFWLLVVVAAAAVALAWKTQKARLRPPIDRLVLRLPVFGTLIHQLELSRFTRSCGLLLHHGIQIVQAMEVALPTISNHAIRHDLERLPGLLQGGNSLANSLKQVYNKNPLLINMVAVGEEGGRVAESLSEVATYYEQEAERSLGIIAALLEPAVMLCVGGVVGFIVMAVLLPIFELGMIAG